MKGLVMMLKALGVNITPEQVGMLEKVIPQVPAKLEEARVFIAGAVTKFDVRLRALEDNQRMTNEKLDALLERSKHEPNGSNDKHAVKRLNGRG